MKYKGIEINEKSISVYLGEDYMHHDWKDNERYFAETFYASDATIRSDFSFECLVDDMISVCVTDDSHELFKDAYEQLSKVFDSVKVNLLLDGVIGDFNSFDLTMDEYEELLVAADKADSITN